MGATIDVSLGMRPGEEHDIAALYAAAFSRKFRPAFGNDEAATSILAPTLRGDRVIVARGDGLIAGVAGFHLDGHGLVAPKLSHMARHRGWLKALYGMVCLSLLDGNKPRSILVMDGITVAEGFRSRGVGARLLTAVVDLARDVGKTAVQLSVIDTNPKARQLYERFGFEPVRTENLGGLGRRLLGFTNATVMQRPV